MGITSDLTIVVAALACVAASILLCVTWDRFPHRARWPARIALLGAGNTAAVVTVALVLNSTFVFYASWDELLGRHPQLRATAVHTGSLDATLAARTAAAYRTGRGVVIPLVIPGPHDGIGTETARIYLPAAYGDPAYAKRDFPVVELLPGVPGGPQTWLDSLHISSVLDQQMATGAMSPTVVVMPVENVASPRDTECVNTYGGPQVADYLALTVRAAVQSALRVDRTGQGWGVTGFSTGGYCATILAAQHPAMFAAAASIEGYLRADTDYTTRNLFHGNSRLRKQADLLWWIQNRAATPVPLLELATRQDKQSYVDIRVLQHVAAHTNWRIDSLLLPSGGHNMGTFSAEVPLALTWLSHRIGAPLTPLPTIDGRGPAPMATVGQPPVLSRTNPAHRHTPGRHPATRHTAPARKPH